MPTKKAPKTPKQKQSPKHPRPKSAAAPQGGRGLDILGGITADEFLRTYWQKRPLLVRQAIPGFQGLLDVDEMAALAAREGVMARLVIDKAPGSGARKKRGGRWELHEGPLDVDVNHMPATGWTFLVQALESLVPGGWELLRRFSFLPAARVDDLMVSYAAPGGSVGPHDDLYDVFLLQGPGRRKWQIATDYDRTVDDAEPVKVLTSFNPEEEYVLEPGDMLYLPPRVAHWGTAVDPCFTYSIGFLAPSHDALLQNFLAFLGQRIAATTPPEALYEDPDLKPVADPLALHGDMVGKVEKLLGQIRWGHDDVEEFLGRLLTGPKPFIQFDVPKPMSGEAFAKKLRANKKGGRVRLAPPTRGLLDARKQHVFLNGEMRPVSKKDMPVMRALLDTRELALPVHIDGETALILYELYAMGGLELS